MCTLLLPITSNNIDADTWRYLSILKQCYLYIDIEIDKGKCHFVKIYWINDIYICHTNKVFSDQPSYSNVKLFIYTGCFKPNLDTLTGYRYCDKYTMCTEKIVVYLFSVHMDISFHSNKSEKNNCLYSKNFNWKLGPWNCDFFLKIHLTILRLFEANMVSWVPY